MSDRVMIKSNGRLVWRYLDVGQCFGLKVNQGLIPGHSVLNKFGENPEIDTGTYPEDIWEAGGMYTYDADGTAPIVSLVSDDAADDGNIIEVIGLDINGEQVTQYITLAGTTRVALTTPLWRVYRMRNTSATSLTGVCYCYVGTGGVPLLADTRAIIDDGNNQTLMTLYTVPKGKVGFLYGGEVGISRGVSGAEVRCSFYARRYGKAFTIKKRVNLSNSGSSIFQGNPEFPSPVPALSDLKFTVEYVSANDVGVFATFDMLLIDETEFPTAYLVALGQPGYGA